MTTASGTAERALSALAADTMPTIPTPRPAPRGGVPAGRTRCSTSGSSSMASSRPSSTVLSLGSVFDAALNLDTDTDSIAEVTAATGGAQVILGGAVSVVAAVIWILLVRQLTARHVQLTGER